jgi:hypothetical protein
MIPVQSVVVSTVVNSLATISIALFPSKYKIQPNTIVHIAYYTDDDPTIYVLGEGIVTGRSATKSKSGNNSDVLEVTDYISLLANVPTLFTPLNASFFSSVWTQTLTSFNNVTDITPMSTALLNLLISGGSIDGAIRKLISGAIGNVKNSSYKMASQPFNLQERVFSVNTSPTIKSLLSSASFMSFVQGSFGQADYNLTLLSLIMSFLQSVGYELITLPVPSLVKSSPTTSYIRQYVATPQLLYGPIPACNWIYSSFFTDFSYYINYNTMPTRIIAPLTFLDIMQQDAKTTGTPTPPPPPPTTTTTTTATSPQDKSTTPTKTARLHAEIGPDELRQLVGSKGLSYLTNSECLTAEESIRGIKVEMHPLDTYLGFVKSTTAKGTNNPVANKSIIETYTDLFFYTARLNAVSTILSTLPFNPYIVPGLPGGIFTTNDGFVGGGPIASVTHTLRATGEATTEVKFAGFADANEYLASSTYNYYLGINGGVVGTLSSPTGGDTSSPTSSMGEGSLTDVNVYQTAFGVKGYSPLNPNMLAYTTKSLENQYAMLKASRPIANLQQLLALENIPVSASTNIFNSFYSSSATSSITPLQDGTSGSATWNMTIFNPTRHAAVMAYKNDVTSSGVKGVF